MVQEASILLVSPSDLSSNLGRKNGNLGDPLGSLNLRRRGVVAWRHTYKNRVSIIRLMGTLRGYVFYRLPMLSSF